MVHPILIGLAALALVACATPAPQFRPVEQDIRVPDKLPDALGEEGLLVATVAAKAVTANAVEQLSFSLAGVQIDNVHYSNAVRDNYLVLPLKPGEYTLEALHVYRSTEERSRRRYPLGYKFRIVKGQATNLGVVTLVRHQTQGTQYWKVLVDNTDEMAAYLRKRYPKLAASLRPDRPVPAAGLKHADSKLLEAVRREIARQAWLTSEDPNLSSHVGDEVGTIAKLLRNSQGKVAAFDVLDTGTTYAMISCSGQAQRFVCSSAEPALYFVEGGSIRKRALSLPVKHVWVHAFAPRGLVLVDEKMNVYASKDDGASWSKHVWHPRKEPLSHLAAIRFANGKNGFYVYSTFTADPLAPQVIYSDYARTGYRTIDIPKLNYWQRLIETSHGLLLGPHNADRKGAPSRLYFRPLGRTDWQARTLPGNRCFFLHRENETHDRLNVYCDSKFYHSTDAGRTWLEKPTAQK